MAILTRSIQEMKPVLITYYWTIPIKYKNSAKMSIGMVFVKGLILSLYMLSKKLKKDYQRATSSCGGAEELCEPTREI